ncbi:MAG: diacylglycerol kinase family protein [Vicinamibacteria bacterium]
MASSRPRASLIYNPKAGRRSHGQTIGRIQAALRTAYDVVAMPTEGPRHAIELARAAAHRSDEAVFAWGGDGTVREVVEGILGAPIALGVLPGGTFNVVALAVGVPRRDPIRAAQMLATAHPRLRDVGLIGDTPFLMQTTIGLDGFIMHGMRADMKARFGLMGALICGLRSFSSYRFPTFDVEVDGATHSVRGAGFVNMAEYAGSYQYVPGARWDDRTAHALLYSGRTHFATLSFAVSMALGRHHLRGDVRIVEAKQMVVRSGPNVFVQTDGDVWEGALPATCRLAKDQINVLIP